LTTQPFASRSGLQVGVVDALRDAGVVDEHVEPAVRLQHRRDQALGTPLVGEVGLHVAAADLAGDLLAGLDGGAAGDDDLVALLRQPSGDLGPDA
jgi:hypothetical protein